MNYAGYVAAAYAVFVVAIVWDWLSSQLALRKLRQLLQKRAQRDAHRARKGSP